MDQTSPSNELPFADYCARVEDRIQRHYGIRIVTRDIPDPLTGDLDGAEIHVDYALTPDQRLFLLAHPDASRLLPHLADLELRGLVRRVGGGRFMRQ